MNFESAEKPYVVFTCTFYKSVDDKRCQCCLDFLRSAAVSGVWVNVVDSSPDTSGVREAMQQAGGPTVVVSKQIAQGKKGAALRESAEVAAGLPGVTEETYLCWQEPEKIDMIHHWKSIFTQSRGDVIVPYRDTALFLDTYPIEQYHSESYANLWLDCCAKTLGPKEGSIALPLDWHFGPFCLRRKHLHFWLSYKGEIWDAQVVPIVHAVRRGLSVCSVKVPFRAPAIMKEEEESNLEFVEKRIMQINFLDPKVKAAWTDEMLL
jgi:hypothetical protein